tara:strand:+ start:892 stop:1146 length:255 start_codon:yes stop_codon:yes gene_type:complete
MATNNIEKQSFGQAGATFESGTNSVGGEFCAILVVEDAVFTSLSWPELAGDAITGVTIPAGVTIYGQINDFKLTSGKVLAYHAA